MQLFCKVHRIVHYGSKDVDENNSKRKRYKQMIDLGENNYTQEKYEKFCDWWSVYFLQTNTDETAHMFILITRYAGQ